MEGSQPRTAQLRALRAERRAASAARGPVGESRAPGRTGAGAAAGLFICSLLGFISVGAALPALSPYVRGPLHSGDLAAGVVVGSFAATSVFCRPVAGRFADRRGRRAVLVGGALTMALGGLLYLLAGSVATLLLARLVAGAGEGAFYTAGATWTVDLAPPHRRGQALGLFGLAVWGGLALGPVAGELLRSWSGYQAVWACTAVLPLLGAAIAVRLPEPARPPRPQGRGGAWLPRAVRRPGTAIALANVGYAALAGFVILDLDAQGIGGGASVFTAFAVAVFASRLALNRIPDRVGARVTGTIAGLVEAAGLVIIALAGSLGAAIAGAVVVGVGFSLLFPSLALMVVRSTDEGERGSAMGAFSAFFDIGVGLGAPLAGLAASLAGYPSVFYMSAAAALGTAWIAATTTHPA